VDTRLRTAGTLYAQRTPIAQPTAVLDAGSSRTRATGVTGTPSYAANPAHVNGLDSLIPQNARPSAAGGYDNDDRYRAATAQLRADLHQVRTLAARGDYAGAARAMETARTREYTVNSSYDNSATGQRTTMPTTTRGEQLLRSMQGTGEAADTLPAVQRQLEFSSRMQAASPGAQLHMPPNEAEVRAYFRTLRGDSSRAISEYTAYAQAFHVHIGRARNYQGDPWSPSAPDVVYSADPNRYQVNSGSAHNGPDFATVAQANQWAQQNNVQNGSLTTLRSSAPDHWGDLTNTGGNRSVASRGPNAGRYVNDCEGFAYMAQELLGEAGFTARAGEGQIASVPARQNAPTSHMMALLRDPSGNPVVVSNDRVFTTANTPSAASQSSDGGRVRSLLHGGWSELHRQGGILSVPTPIYYSGPTSADAQRAMNAENPDRELRFNP
jgi:hypothetical protein